MYILYAKYNYKIDNYLRIDATGSSDVVVKIINSATEECIRCVFINGGSNYEIVNIPEGIYYLKIAYGYDWSKKVSGSFCFAKFMRDVHYQIGNDQLDYFLKDYGSSYDVPSFELVLKVLSNSAIIPFLVISAINQHFGTPEMVVSEKTLLSH